MLRIMSAAAETLFHDKVIPFTVVMNDEFKIFRRNVERHMQQQGLNEATVAKKAGVATKTVNNALAGRHSSQIDILVKIANAIGVEFWMLWLPEPPTDPKNDRLLQSLTELGSQLSGDAMHRVARMAELELNAERFAAKSRPKAIHPQIHPKTE